MIDPTPREQAAIKSVLLNLGDYVASIGMDRPLSAYSKEEILTLIEVAVTSYQDFLIANPEPASEVPF